jgi:hypothetical protein
MMGVCVGDASRQIGDVRRMLFGGHAPMILASSEHG